MSTRPIWPILPTFKKTWAYQNGVAIMVCKLWCVRFGVEILWCGFFMARDNVVQ